MTIGAKPVCPSCGETLQPGMRLCGQCGRPARPPGSAPPPATLQLTATDLRARAPSVSPPALLPQSPPAVLKPPQEAPASASPAWYVSPSMAPPVGPSATPPPPAVGAGGPAPTTGRGPMVWAAGGAGVVLASAVLTLLAYRTVAPDRSSEALARVPQAPVEQVPVGQEPVVNPTVKAVEEPVEVPPVETAVVSRSLPPAVAEASCRTDGQSDATGRTITYEPAQTIDGDLSTAWRCAGSAVGQELTLRLAGLTTVTSVGLVPGYAKVDPADGIDRFALYRTVTGVEWRFDDGTVVAQDVSAPSASMTTVELAEPVTTSSVTMVVMSTGNDAAEYDFTAVSEVELSGF